MNRMFFSAMFAAACSGSAFAQSCSAPIVIATTSPVAGNTCSGSVQLPSLIDGAIQNANPQIVYRTTIGPAANVSLVLQPDGTTDMSMFVCPNQCSTAATCMAVDAAGAGGVENAALPTVGGDYYVIVQSSNGTSPACGTYTLTVQAPLDD